MTAAEQCRLETGLTLAEAARRVGVSRQTLYDWKRNDPDRFAAALKEAKDVQVD
jgi:DNA-binding XRE family transcriptional regulator